MLFVIAGWPAMPRQSMGYYYWEYPHFGSVGVNLLSPSSRINVFPRYAGNDTQVPTIFTFGGLRLVVVVS